MSSKGMNRRQFLRTSGIATAGAAVAAGGAVLTAADGAWALELTTLDAHTGETLLAVARQCYPHDTLGDQYYAGVVAALDGDAAGSKDVAKTLTDGVADLDAAMGVAFKELSQGHQLALLKERESSGFFQAVRGKSVVALYNNPLVWRHFGFEGSSFEYGGYIDRGFNDLSWLPTPPADASPKKA